MTTTSAALMHVAFQGAELIDAIHSFTSRWARKIRILDYDVGVRLDHEELRLSKCRRIINWSTLKMSSSSWHCWITALPIDLWSRRIAFKAIVQQIFGG